jgi:hypothetical protein
MNYAPVTSTIALSAEQKTTLARALNLDVKLIPAEIPVLAIAKGVGEQLGRPIKAVTFSPVLLED